MFKWKKKRNFRMLMKERQLEEFLTPTGMGTPPPLPATPQRCSQVGYSTAPISQQRTVSKLDGWYQITSST